MLLTTEEEMYPRSYSYKMVELGLEPMRCDSRALLTTEKDDVSTGAMAHRVNSSWFYAVPP